MFYRQKLCKITFTYLKNLFSLICGFWIQDNFQFLVLGLPWFTGVVPFLLVY